MFSSGYKRYVTVVLLAAYVFNRADAAMFGFLMEPIKQEFGLSDGQLGFLAGPAMVLFYAALGIPVARLADRSSRVNIMSIAIAFWSCIVALSSAVTSFWHFALARVGVGVGEAGFSAVAQSLITDYHRPTERTRALSIFMLGIPLGKVVSSLVAGWINQLYGWRMVFLVAGLPGIALALLMKGTIKEPPRPSLDHARATSAVQVPLRAVFARFWRQRSLRHLALGTALGNVVCFSLLAWTPAFFLRNHAMNSGELGTWLAVVSGVGGSLGVWLGGYLTSRLQDWRVRLRLIALVTALLAPVGVAALWISPKEIALMILMITYLFMFFFFGPAFSLVQELAGATMRATMASVFILLQTLAGGVVGVQVLGVLSDALAALASNNGEALRWSMTCTCLLALWAAVHFVKAGRSILEDVTPQPVMPSDEAASRAGRAV
jgi:MFS family permease